MAISVAAARVQAMGATLATDIGAGALIRIYTGAKPATPETAATGTLLVTITVTGSFTSTGGVLAAADPAAATPVANGTAGYFRLLTSGATAVLDGTVATTGADMNLSSVALTTSTPVDIGVPSFTVPVA